MNIVPIGRHCADAPAAVASKNSIAAATEASRDFVRVNARVPAPQTHDPIVATLDGDINGLDSACNATELTFNSPVLAINPLELALGAAALTSRPLAVALNLLNLMSNPIALVFSAAALASSAAALIPPWNLLDVENDVQNPNRR